MILINAPMATRESSGTLPLLIRIGSATLKVSRIGLSDPIPLDMFPNSGWEVVAGAAIEVVQSEPNPYRIGASLWYADLNAANPAAPHEYRWWEVGYVNRVKALGNVHEPFALTDLGKADLAAAHGLLKPTRGVYEPLDLGPDYVSHSHALAYKPNAIDDIDFDSFVDRWAQHLANAYSGYLTRPDYLV